MGSELSRLLEQKRAELVRDLEALRAGLADLSARIQLKEGQLKNVVELLELENGKTAAPNPDSAQQNGTPRRAPFLAAAAALLEHVDRAMHYRQLAATLARQDVYVPGRDPAANLLAHMTRDARFRRFGRGLYGLQHWPQEKAVRERAKRSGRRAGQSGSHA